MSGQLADLVEVLESLVVLYPIPVMVLRMIATYAIIGPNQGRCVAKIIGQGGFTAPVAMAFSEATRELLVLDDNPRVQVFSLTDLKFVRAWGTRGYGPGQFSNPRGVCVDESNGRVFVADIGNNRVQELQLDGTFIRFIGDGWLLGPWGFL